jgi:hypothetical protein
VRKRAVCERCGAPALVSITSELGASASVRHLCLACADSEECVPEADRTLNYSAVLISIGAVVALLSGAADYLGAGRVSGFGWKQDAGILAAGVIVFLSTLLRIPTLFAIGALGGILAALADMLKFGREPGFGWDQGLGVLLGVILIAAGLLEAHRQT